MRKLVVFNSVSLDGYFTDKNNDMGWAKEGRGNDKEFYDFTAENAKGGGVLLFGRITYDLMAGFWPTPQAAQMMPEVAAQMNNLPKIVFSRRMDKAEWKNTTLIKDDPVGAVRKLKSQPGSDMVILGSGTIVAQLAPENLIDEYQFVVVPIVLGSGRTMFEGVKNKIALTRTQSRTFANGRVFLRYELVA